MRFCQPKLLEEVHIPNPNLTFLYGHNSPQSQHNDEAYPRVGIMGVKVYSIKADGNDDNNGVEYVTLKYWKKVTYCFVYAAGCSSIQFFFLQK